MIGAGTVGRALLSIPATRRTSHGFGWPAAMATLLAVIAAVTIVLSGSTTPKPQVTDESRPLLNRP